MASSLGVALRGLGKPPIFWERRLGAATAAKWTLPAAVTLHPTKRVSVNPFYCRNSQPKASYSTQHHPYRLINKMSARKDFGLICLENPLLGK